MSTPKASKRFKLQVNIVNVGEEKLIQNWSAKPVKKFLLLTEANASLLSVRRKIEDMFSKLYPSGSRATVTRLRDSSLCELDDDFKVSEVFDESNIVYAVLANNPMNQKKPAVSPVATKTVPEKAEEQTKKRKQNQNETNTKVSPEQKVPAPTVSNTSDVVKENTEVKQTPEPQPKKKKAKKKNQQNVPVVETTQPEQQVTETVKAVPNKKTSAVSTSKAPQTVKSTEVKGAKSDQPAKEITKAPQQTAPAAAKKPTGLTKAQTQAQAKKQAPLAKEEPKVAPKKVVTPPTTTPVTTQKEGKGKKQVQQDTQKNAASLDKPQEPSQPPQKTVVNQPKNKKAKNTPAPVSQDTQLNDPMELDVPKKAEVNKKQNTVVDKKSVQKEATPVEVGKKNIPEQMAKPVETPSKKRKAETPLSKNKVEAEAPDHNVKDSKDTSKNNKVVENKAKVASPPANKQNSKGGAPNPALVANDEKTVKAKVTTIPAREPAKTIVKNTPTVAKSKPQVKANINITQPEVAAPLDTKGAKLPASPSPAKGKQESTNKKPEAMAPLASPQKKVDDQAKTIAATSKGQAKKVNSATVIPDTPTPHQSDAQIDSKSNTFGIQLRDTTGVEAGRMMGRLLLGADEDDDEEDGVEDIASEPLHTPPVIMSSKKAPALARVTSAIMSQNSPIRKEQVKPSPMESTSTPVKVASGKPAPESSSSGSSSDSNSDDSSDDDNSASKPTPPNMATPNTNASKASQMYTPYQKPSFSSLRQIAASAKLTNLAAKASAIAGGVTPTISKNRPEPMETSSSEEDNASDSDSSSSSSDDSDNEKTPVAKTPQLNVRLAGQKSKGRNKRKSALFQLARDA
ncbi:hypothetical protein K7432_001287 [Basidiobolus ranarum]|uniref:Nucleolar protein Dnt1-like N-terminal domain-containing protein n=1 Tax=Basidiobolus ranarum TaxID=34480 RepID=A0ABR2W9V4_9FUNG